MNIKDVTEAMIGKTVTWTSQSAGVSKTKTGKVVAVVAAGAIVGATIRRRPDLAKYRTCNSMPNPGITRDHNSVLVAVDNDLYWPLVSKLEVIEE
jgi:hypothetical protein